MCDWNCSDLKMDQYEQGSWGLAQRRVASPARLTPARNASNAVFGPCGSRESRCALRSAPRAACGRLSTANESGRSRSRTAMSGFCDSIKRGGGALGTLGHYAVLRSRLARRRHQAIPDQRQGVRAISNKSSVLWQGPSASLKSDDSNSAIKHAPSATGRRADCEVFLFAEQTPRMSLVLLVVARRG